MTYELIESYSDQVIDVEGRILPDLCLVEDADTIRILLAPSRTIPVGVWHQALDGGAAAIYVLDVPGWITSETFMRTRVDQPGSYGVPLEAVTPSPPVGYRQMVTAPEPVRHSVPFVQLHAHSDHSALDGLSTIQEMVKAAEDDGQPAIAVTDHGVCAAHPLLQETAEKAGIIPIFGLEAYFVPDRHARGAGPRPKADEGPEAMEQWKARDKIARDYEHLVLWAMDDEGLRNLWAMSTASYMEGFYGKPRLDWEVLERFSAGVMASTACLRGPLARSVLSGDETGAQAKMGRLLSIFGDRLYAEIHTNSLPDQRIANEGIIRLANEHGVPTIAVTDSHYPCADDAHAHKVWLSAQTNKALSDDSGLFEGEADYHLLTHDEVRRSLSYLPERIVDESVTNTVAVAERCTARLKKRLVYPTFSRKGSDGSTDDAARRQRDLDRGVEICLANWGRTQGASKKHSPEVYMARFEKEAALLTTKGFWGYFLMVEDQVRFAKENGVLVGPGRGSGGGSLIAYLMGITEIDPVQHDLLFERFLTEGREEPPDFDIDYPTSKRDLMQTYCTDRWGDEHTMRVGTHTRLKNKGTFKALSSVFREQVDFKDFATIASIIDRAEGGSAGLGISWDDLWAQVGDELEPYQEKYPDVFALAERFVGRLKSYGRHAAGMVISPDEPLNDRLPMRASDESEQPISQFDMDALTFLGLIKFDLLTLRNLDTLQECIDLIRERRGITINVYDWDAEYDDPEVWEQICEGHTMGLFQVETASGTRMIRRFKPTSIGELADVITLVRPGPQRSGLTDSYLRRREGWEDVALPDPRMAEVLAPTWGCIIYQEQVMKAGEILAGYTLEEADGVRRILGKKKVEMVKAAGEEFIPRCIERGMAPGDAEHLWEQLGEFAKYSFNRSHAFGYAVVGYWTAWFKFHYPMEFLIAALSTVPGERIPDFANEARRMGYDLKPPDINASGRGFTAEPLACRYGFEAVAGIAEASASAVLEGQPYTSFEDFMERKGKAANASHVLTLAEVGAFDSLVPNRRALVERLTWDASPDAQRCTYKDEGVVGPGGLPCTFDWSSEPVVLGKSGRPLKNQPRPPKRCTKSCRNYSPPAPPEWGSMEDYTPDEVMAIERRLLGTYVTYSPFDRIPEDSLAECDRGSAVEAGAPGQYLVAAVVSRVKPHTDRHGNPMGFLDLYAQDATLDVVVFKDAWGLYRPLLQPDALVLALVNKTTRGLNLATPNESAPSLIAL